MNAVRTTLLVALAAVVLIGTGAAAGAVAATPNSGGAGPPSDLPGNAPLTFNAAFEIRENARTTFTADFAPVLRGNGRYLLRPVPSGIEVDYETDGDGSSGENETADS